MNKQTADKWNVQLTALVNRALEGDTMVRGILEALWGEPWDRTGSPAVCGLYELGIEVKILNRGQGNWQLFWEEGVALLYSVCHGIDASTMTLAELQRRCVALDTLIKNKKNA